MKITINTDCSLLESIKNAIIFEPADTEKLTAILNSKVNLKVLNVQNVKDNQLVTIGAELRS